MIELLCPWIFTHHDETASIILRPSFKWRYIPWADSTKSGSETPSSGVNGCQMFFLSNASSFIVKFFTPVHLCALRGYFFTTEITEKCAQRATENFLITGHLLKPSFDYLNPVTSRSFGKKGTRSF